MGRGPGQAEQVTLEVVNFPAFIGQHQAYRTSRLDLDQSRIELVVLDGDAHLLE